jgi:hypothetical protein
MNFRRLPAVAGVLGPFLLLAGCAVSVDSAGPTQYDSRSFDRAGIEELHLNLDMGAGSMKVGAGTHKLAQAYFSYNIPAWNPEVRYDSQGTRANLSIRQHGQHGPKLGSVKNEWDLRLSQEVPLYVNVNCGAGEAQLDLGSLPLRDVTVEMGVGKLDLDLRGEPKRDYNVRIHGGVGEAAVHLPSSAGVYAEASGGIGSIETPGLRKVEGHWVNDAYDRAKVRIHVSVEGGVGSIKLIGE